MGVSRTSTLRAVMALLAFSLVLAAQTALTGPAAAAPPSECREQTCVASLSVGRKAVNWRSTEVFYPENEQVFADLGSRGSSLTRLRSYGPELCKHRFFGSGMTVVVRACGPRTPLRVRAVRLKKGKRELRVSYMATPILDGPPSGQPGTAGGLDPLAPILQPITGLLGL